MKKIDVKIKKMDVYAKIPTYGTEYSACADLYSNEQVIVKPHETEFVHTGICMAIPKDYAGYIYARSGLSCRSGLAPANKVGVIDADYRGEIMVALHNHSDIACVVNRYDRIAQINFEPYYQADFEIVGELDSTDRGNGGFGSTGK